MAQPLTEQTARIDDLYRIQADAAMRQLRADLEADPRTVGLDLPDCFGIEPSVGGSIVVRHGVGVHDASDSIEGRAWSYVQIRGQAWDRAQPNIVTERTRTALLEEAHRALRLGAQDMVQSDLPSWAVLVHPVVLAVLLSHEPNRRMLPQRMRPEARSAAADRRWPVDNDYNPTHRGRCGIATGKCWIEQGVLLVERMGVLAPVQGSSDIACLQLVSIPSTTTLSVPCRLPNTAIEALVGRPIGDVVSLPSSGCDDIDRAAAATVIAAVLEMPSGLQFTFEDAVHLPYGDHFPSDALRRTMHLAPIRR